MRLIHTHSTTHTSRQATPKRTTKHYVLGLLLAIVAIAVFPLLTSHNAHAASGTALSLSPASQSVTTGSTMTVAIMLDTGGDSINTVQSVFTYSATHYTLVSITPSSSFSSFPDTLSSGSVEFSAATSTAVNGSGITVATVVLQSTGTGTSSLTLASVCGSGDFAATCSAAYDSTTSNNDLSSVANGSYTVNPVVVPLPSTPTGVSATANSATSVTVKWTGSTDTGGPGVAGYYILRGGTKVGSVSSTTTSYTDTTAAADTTYNYTVEAYDSATPPNVSAQSSAASVTTPKPPAPSVPTGVTATANSSTSVTVKWTGSTDTGGPGLAGYDVYRNGTLLAGSTTPTYTDTTVAPNTAYSYTIAAYDSATPPNVSAQSSAASVTTPKIPAPSTPTGVSATANSATSVTVKWTGSTDTGGPGLAGYYVLRGGTKVGSVSSTTTSYTDTTAVADTAYSYTIEAYDTASTPNVSAQSSAATVTTPKTPAPSTPTGITATANSSTSVTVKWTGSTDTGGPGVAGYYILRGGTKVGSVSATAATSYTDTTVAAGTKYSYTVEAYDKATPVDISSPSSAASVTTPAPPAPTAPTGITATANSSTSVTVKWTGSTDTGGPGVAGYYILRGGTKIGSVSGTATTSYTDTTVAANTAYSYTIEAYDSATPPNVSAQSSAATVTTPKTPAPTAPSGVTATANSATSVTVKWTASTDAGGPGVAGYYILRNGTTIAQISAVSYTDTTVAGGTTYSYTIEAYDTASTPNVSAQSSAANVTTPSVINAAVPTVPTAVEATAVNTSQINLSWTASTANVHVEGYYVYRSTHADTAFALVGTTATNSYGDTNLSAGTTYYYYVVAYDSAGRSTNSATVNAVTKASVTTTTTTIEGKVTSTTTRRPIAGAFVRTGIRGTSEGAATSYTNSSGNYVLDTIKANTAQIYHYTANSYRETRVYENFPAGVHTLNASLTPKPTHHRQHRR